MTDRKPMGRPPTGRPPTGRASWTIQKDLLAAVKAEAARAEMYEYEIVEEALEKYLDSPRV